MAIWLLIRVRTFFPGFYLLSETINKPLVVLHKPVPHFNEKLLMSVERTLKRFRPDQPFERSSWMIADDRNLFWRASSSSYACILCIYRACVLTLPQITSRARQQSTRTFTPRTCGSGSTTSRSASCPGRTRSSSECKRRDYGTHPDPLLPVLRRRQAPHHAADRGPRRQPARPGVAGEGASRDGACDDDGGCPVPFCAVWDRH